MLARTTRAESEAPNADSIQRILHVRSGATCLTAEDLAAHIPSWLHGEELARDIDVWVDGSPTDPRDVSVRLTRAGEVVARREFQPGPEDCAQLQSAVSLSIAMALRASTPEAPTPEAPTPPPPTPPPTTPPPPAPRHARENVQRLALFVGGSAVFRLLPETIAGPEMRAELALGRYVVVRAGALGLITRNVPLAETSSHFDSFLIAARTAACGRVTLAGPLSGHACLGVLGGALLIRGRGDSAPPPETLGWAAFTSELGLTLAASKHVLVTVEPGIVVPLRDVRIGIVDANDDVVASISLRAIAFSLGLSVGYSF